MNVLLKKAAAECFGTAMLTLVACGVAVATRDYLATCLAFGFVIVALAYSIGNISGCHINPAVSLAMAIRKEISWKEFGVYVASQVVGAFVGTLLLAAFMRSFNVLGGNAITGFLANMDEWGRTNLDAWSYIGAFLIEVILTCLFVFAILGVTDKKFGNGTLGGIVIGIALVLVHLIGCAFTGTSVNPARGLSASICQLFANNKTSAEQVWIWVLAPFAGGAIAPFLYSFFFGKKEDKAEDPSSNLETPKEEE
jgi:aquaporin Z